MKKGSIISTVSFLLLGGLAVLAVKAQHGDFDELIEKDGLEGLDIDGDIVDLKSKKEEKDDYTNYNGVDFINNINDEVIDYIGDEIVYDDEINEDIEIIEDFDELTYDNEINEDIEINEVES